MGLRQVVARAFVLLLAAATFASGQTLADVAKKEEERRKAVKQPSKVITNEDLKPVRTPDRPATAPAAAPTESAKPAQPGTAPPADASAKPPAPGAATPAKPAGEASPGEKKDETYWRNRITTVRTALQRNLVYVDAIGSTEGTGGARSAQKGNRGPDQGNRTDRGRSAAGGRPTRLAAMRNH
ncbi:MAG: hypothetical protein HYZ58_04975 [Acidobacteria bacterium]|nr:hypothetical protein [Acidobacteriota bacterium]